MYLASLIDDNLNFLHLLEPCRDEKGAMTSNSDLEVADQSPADARNHAEVHKEHPDAAADSVVDGVSAADGHHQATGPHSSAPPGYEAYAGYWGYAASYGGGCSRRRSTVTRRRQAGGAPPLRRSPLCRCSVPLLRDALSHVTCARSCRLPFSLSLTAASSQGPASLTARNAVGLGVLLLLLRCC